MEETRRSDNIYGLNVVYKDADFDDYIRFRASVIKVLNEARDMLQERKKFTAPHEVLLANNSRLSFCIANKGIEFGFRDNDGVLHSQCDFEEIGATSRDIDALEVRCKHLVKAERDIVRDDSLNRAWGKELVLRHVDKAKQMPQIVYKIGNTLDQNIKAASAVASRTSSGFYSPHTIKDPLPSGR